MTLIVGVRCSNGVVMGADSAATFSQSNGAYTIRSENIRKIHVLEGKILLGMAGSVAMAQRIAPLFSDIWKQAPNGRLKDRPQAIIGDMPSHEAADFIRRVLLERVYHVEAAAAELAVRARWANASEESIVMTMAAIPTKNAVTLFTFNPVGLPEEVTESLFCCNIGNGQAIADPFMGFMRKVLWNDKLPTVEQATLGVVWCLRHAISLHPGGVSGAIQVCTLVRRKDNRCEASELSVEALQEHHQMVEDGEGLLRAWHAGEPPKPPQPVSAIPEMPKI